MSTALLGYVVLTLLTLVALPMLINKSTEGRGDWIKKYLREAWFVVAMVYVVIMTFLPAGRDFVRKNTPAFAASHPIWSYIIVGIGAATVACVYWFALGKLAAPPNDLKDQQGEVQKGPPTLPTPSLVFVFGVPLGDNDSASWMMMLRHYGPSPAYNCDIGFYDDDRKNIEHQWLAAHPYSPFPPPGLAGESQKRIYVAEAGPEGSSGGFHWKPVDPDRQHYTVTISCREGMFVEKWEVTRVDGILRSTITIEHGPRWREKNPNLDPVVFRCKDPEFITTSLATELPKSSKGKLLHPGWKPKHRFEVPAAILDPNGHVQVISGIPSPDGTTLTDFGCWNILTRHFGDNPEGEHVKQ